MCVSSITLNILFILQFLVWSQGMMTFGVHAWDHVWVKVDDETTRKLRCKQQQQQQQRKNQNLHSFFKVPFYFEKVNKKQSCFSWEEWP